MREISSQGSIMTMRTHRPYMIRALNEWILDNKCTPYILVNALAPGVGVPQSFVKDGQIILNISPRAVQQLSISNDLLEFSGRFGGVPMDVTVPVHAILGIYARENGQGMIFETDDPIPEPPRPAGDSAGQDSSSSRTSRKPSLRLVK